MRRLPVYLLLDTSGSMRGDAMAGVNGGLQMLTTLLRQDPNALEMAYLSVITFDDVARQVVPMTELLQFQTPKLSVDKGLTSLGAALKLLAERIEAEVVKTDRTRKGDWLPVVFIMTDGEPTDDWQTGLKRLRQVKTGTVVACALGQQVDTLILKEITPNVVEMTKANPDTLKSFFKWVSASVSSVSQKIDLGRGDHPELAQLPDLPEEISIVKEPRKGTGGGASEVDSPFNNARARRAANMDKYGNPEGADFDLARDGAFAGLTIGVLHLYTQEGFDFSYPTKALKEKGFGIERWTSPPSFRKLQSELKKCCQLWVISGKTVQLNDDHRDVIRDYFISGRGVYVWGDNDPFCADAGPVAHALFGGDISGNLEGDQVVGHQGFASSGMNAKHPVCTGLETLYEGITIATVHPHPELTPVVVGSQGNVVVAAYEKHHRRALLDGGFTRLYTKWDSAGTGRYVKNAAAWLVNYERFGAELLSSDTAQ